LKVFVHITNPGLFNVYDISSAVCS